LPIETEENHEIINYDLVLYSNPRPVEYEEMLLLSELRFYSV
jgi:hypothetical protein